MKNTVTLTVQDLIVAKKLSLRPKKIYIVFLTFLLAVMFLFIVFGVFTSPTQKKPDYSWLWAIGLTAYFGLIYYYIVYASAKKQFKQNKKLSEPFEIEITEDSIRTKASHGESELKFTDFHKWKSDNKMILLYHSDALFQIIPTRAFTSEAERLDIIEKIKNHAGNPAK